MKKLSTLRFLFVLLMACPLQSAIGGNPPTFTEHPQSVMVPAGATLRLSCVATGSPPISYIWQKGLSFLGNQTNAMLVVSNAGMADAGDYAALASDANGVSRSQTARVVVYTNTPCNFPWVWLRTYRGEIDCVSQQYAGMAVAPTGEIYLAGSICSTNGDTDFLTIKMDSAGNELWRATYGSPAMQDDRPLAVAVDADGNCYVAGSSYAMRSPSEWGYDGFTIKYSPEGQVLWTTRQVGTGQQSTEIRAITPDGTGGAFVSGLRGTLRYDAAGSPLWTNANGGFFICRVTNDNSLLVAAGHGTSSLKKLSGTGEELWAASVTNVQGLCVDASGNTYAAASYGFNWLANQGDVQTVKIGPDGAIIWSRLYNSPFNFLDTPHGIKVDAAGNVVVSGTTYRAPSQQAQQLGQTDLVVLKYDAEGNLLWAYQFNDAADQEEIPYALAVDGDAAVYVSGATEWEPTGSQRAALLLKLDAEGNLLWASRYQTGPVGQNYFLQMDLRNDGTLTVAGSATYQTDYYYTALLVAQYDQHTPRLVIAGEVAPGVRQGCLVSPRWSAFDILAATNLVYPDWQAVDTVTNLNGLVPFYDPDAGQYPMRFYRASQHAP